MLLVLLLLLMLLMRVKSFCQRKKSLSRPKKLVFVSLRQCSFITGPTKLVFVCIEVYIFTGLAGPLSLRPLSFLTGPNKLVFVRIILLLV